MELEEVKKSADQALAALTEYKNTAEALKTEFDTMKPKIDAFDEAKIKKLADDILKAADDSAKFAAQQTKAHEALEANLKQIEAAVNRPGATSLDDRGKELAAKRNKLFNTFAKQKSTSTKETFDEYLEKHVTDEAERKALSVGTDSAGGYTVFPEFGGVIMTKIYESSPIRQLASVTTIGTDVYEVVTDNDEAGAGWVGETDSRAETTTPTLGKISIPAHEVYANPKATQKIIDDSIIDIESWLAGKVAQKFARIEATAFVSGNGVNKPRGLLTHTAGTDITLQQVEQVNSGTSAAFTYAGLVNLQNALKEGYQGNATFLTKRTSLANILLILDGNSRPIFNGNFDKNTGLEMTLMGRPLRFAEDMTAVGADALAMIYGDIRQAYQIVDRKGVTVLRDPYTAKPYIHFYTTKRVGGHVVNFEAYKIQKLAS